MTNFDRIKAMSVEEMAEFLENMEYGECYCCPYRNKVCPDTCKIGYKEFLESEVETEE